MELLISILFIGAFIYFAPKIQLFLDNNLLHGIHKQRTILEYENVIAQIECSLKIHEVKYRQDQNYKNGLRILEEVKSDYKKLKESN